MNRLIIFSLFVCITIFPLSVFSFEDNREEIIKELTRLIQVEKSKDKLATYYCHRARHYTKIGNMEMAEKDYLSAIGYNYTGWLISEFGEFLFFNEQYEKAYKLSHKLEDDFPHFSEQANELKKKAKERYNEEYLKENPPTIIMDTVPNYAYKSRIQLINEVKARDAMMVIPNRIAAHCRNKWGSNQEMVDYCIKNQTEAHSSVSSYNMDEIKSQCQQKWGTNYEMVEYCIKNQSSAKQSVSQHGRGTIKNYCQQKWGTNYEMVEYCIKNQSSSRQSINRNYSNHSKRSRCESKWGTNYEMVEYCIKN